MGLFDKMFGGGVAQAERDANAAKRFDQLKSKYHSLLTVGDQQGIRLQNLHVQDNKLYMKGTAPSENAKNAFWTELKRINPVYDDITAEIYVTPSAAGAAPAATTQTYTVKSGDTLSKISKQFYGDANEYMRIFYANRQTISDPDKIQVGQTLTIPADTDD